jgi:acyl-coenzyme A synthetase/AMP-(fatty) acid ligase
MTLAKNEPFAKWFVGGKLNVSVNCLDRHVNAGAATGLRFVSRANREALDD